jgi:hypothetical protein
VRKVEGEKREADDVYSPKVYAVSKKFWNLESIKITKDQNYTFFNFRGIQKGFF